MKKEIPTNTKLREAAQNLLTAIDKWYRAENLPTAVYFSYIRLKALL